MSVNIISETKREVLERPPPENAISHIWHKGTAPSGKATMPASDTVIAYVNKHAEAKMRNHALAYRNQKLEVMGLLLGEVRTWQGQEYVLVRDVVTTDLDATSVSVKFDNKGFEKLFAGLDDAGFDYVVVGWYHSHPGYGCFLSETDIKTHGGIFVSPHQVAIVIDPLNFQIEAFLLRKNEGQINQFKVYWDAWDDPYGGLRKIKK
ncbi:MAG: Mov34/MPN/PAD-1 family protein [Thermoplasmata archaeon]|nr:Mov34/MPN/PAD-1 family protein [Thermoplasmata archaeon]